MDGRGTVEPRGELRRGVESEHDQCESAARSRRARGRLAPCDVGVVPARGLPIDAGNVTGNRDVNRIPVAQAEQPSIGESNRQTLATYDGAVGAGPVARPLPPEVHRPFAPRPEAPPHTGDQPLQHAFPPDTSQRALKSRPNGQSRA